MIFMEGDGFGVHSQRDPFEIDRSRRNLLVIAGWAPLRFTWRRLCRAPVGVVNEVREARQHPTAQRDSEQPAAHRCRPTVDGQCDAGYDFGLPTGEKQRR